jgi:hypothetical protein
MYQVGAKKSGGASINVWEGNDRFTPAEKTVEFFLAYLTTDPTKEKTPIVYDS